MLLDSNVDMPFADTCRQGSGLSESFGQHHLDSTSRRKFIETVIDDSIENGVNTWVLVFHLHSITGCLLLTSSRARGGLVDSPTQTC